MNELHGTSLEELAATRASPATLGVLEGLLDQWTCGFVFTRAWGKQPSPVVFGRQRGFLAKPVTDLPVSVRALNCFERAGVLTVGDLVRCTELTLLRLHGLGRSTLREIRSALEELGLDLSAPAGAASREEPDDLLPTDWPISAASRDRLIAAGCSSLAEVAERTERTLLDLRLVSLGELLSLAEVLWRRGLMFAAPRKEAKRLHVDLNLLCTIKSLGWPGKAGRILADSRLLDVAFRASATLADEGLDEEQISWVECELWRHGLGLGYEIDSRARQHAEDLAAACALDLSLPPPASVGSSRFLEDELDRFVRCLDDDRNTRIAARCFGWDGCGGARDVRVAGEFSLSRERIRQVREHVLGRFQAHVDDTPVLDALIRYVAARAPAWSNDIEDGLLRVGLCRGAFRLEGAMHAAQERGIPFNFVMIGDPPLRLVVPRGSEPKAETILRRTRRAVGAGDRAALTRALLELGGHPGPSFPVGSPPPAPVGPSPSQEAPPEVASIEVGSTWEVALWTLTRASERGLLPAKRPWSLIELGWEAADLERLRQWGQIGEIAPQRELTWRKRIAGTDLTAREAVALVFLAYAMDVGRREAHEGELWPFVKGSLSARLQERLFTEGGMLRVWMRDAIEATCPGLGLRHVFGQEGVQAWIRTVFLQFGVSEAGWERLPWWLSGHQSTVTIDDLLNPVGHLQSESFSQLWKRLQAGRFGHRGEARLRQELHDLASPWLVAVDPGHIAAAALARPEIVRVDPELRNLVDPAESDVGLLSEPRLRWDSGREPKFEIMFSTNRSGYGPGQYLLVLEGRARVPVVCQSDGWLMPSGSLMIDAHEARVPFQLVHGDMPVLQDTLVLCDLEEDVAVFDLATGRRLEAWTAVPSGRGVALLTRSDLTVMPQPPLWSSVFGDQWRLWRLDAGLTPATTVALGPQTVWAPVLRDSAPQPPAGRAWNASGTSRWGDIVRVRIEMLSGLEPLGLRIGTHSYDVSTADGAHFASVTLDPSVGRQARARVISVSQGRRTVLPVQLDLRTWGAARQCPGGGWEAIGADDILEPAELGSGRLLVSAPPGSGIPHSELAILEGHTFQARPRSAERGLATSLHGLGAALTLCRGPYNRVDEPIILAASVVASGLLAEIGLETGRLHLRLRDPIEGSPEHSVWLWYPGLAAPEPVPVGRLRYDGDDWLVLDTREAPLACAVAYRGTWLGARFVEPSTGPAEMASLVETAHDWHSLALWLRWWRAPVLHKAFASAIDARVLREPAPTLSAWLGRPTGLAQELSLAGDDAAWPTVLQRFFWRWQPSPLQAASLIAGLGLLSGDPAKDVRDGWTAFEDLLSSHPALLALIAREGVPVLYPGAKPHENAWLLRALRNRIAGVDDSAGESEWRGARARLLASSSESMQVDSGFIDVGLLREARQLASAQWSAHENLQVALVVGALRRFVAASLLNEFAQAIQ